MFSRLLVPLDGSRVSEQVLPFAQLLARTMKIGVELLGVIDLSEAGAHQASDRALYLEPLITRAEQSAREYLERMGRRLSGVQVTISVARGKPAEAIIDRAAELAGALIAMATHGRSGLNRWLLGSVAEKVLRGTASPLFLIRAADADPEARAGTLRSIIVPLDGSKLAEGVLPLAAELAMALDAGVLLFRAFELPARAYYGREDYLPDYDALTNRLKKECQEYLDRHTSALQAKGVRRVGASVREGVGAEEIIRCAREKPDSMVLMCTHGRSGVKRWVLGSVTEKVVRHSGDPVLVVKREAEER